MVVTMKISLDDAFNIMTYHIYYSRIGDYTERIDKILEKYGLSGRLDEVVEAIMSKDSKICKL